MYTSFVLWSPHVPVKWIDIRPFRVISRTIFFYGHSFVIWFTSFTHSVWLTTISDPFSNRITKIPFNATNKVESLQIQTGSMLSYSLHTKWWKNGWNRKKKNEKKKNNREYIQMARRNNHSKPKINWIKDDSEKGKKQQRNRKNYTQGIHLNDMIASTLITQCQNFSATQSLNMINYPPLIHCSLFVDDFSALVLYFWIFRDSGFVAWDLGLLVLVIICVCAMCDYLFHYDSMT